MALDGLMLAGIIRHLEPLNKGRIGKIQNLSDEEIIFCVHTAKGLRRLVINVHSNTNRLYLSRNSEELSPVPSNFVMVLRKRISQGIITAIEQIGFDRALRIRIQGFSEIGDVMTYDLYAELMGKYANLILVDAADNTIIDCLKRIPVYENSQRLLHPGARYQPPQQPERQSVLAPVSIDRDSSLVKQFQGFSPLLSREFLFRLNRGESFAQITDQLLNSDSLYIYEREYHCLPLEHLEQTPVVLSLMEGLDHLYEQDEQKIRIKEQCGDVFRVVEKEKKKAQKKLPKLMQALDDSRDYARYAQYGDLLFAAIGQIDKKPVVELEDWDSQKMVQIPLDMRYDIKDNANLYYKKYHKLKRGQAMLEEQIDACKEDIEYFSLLDEQLRHCSAKDAMEIRQELVDRRILFENKRKPGKKKKAKNPNALHLNVEGMEIYVGKNNLQNSWITHKLGRRSDYWFHVKDYHGSHVLLRCEPGTQPEEAAIRLCAQLAAYFSKSRDSSSVPVDYTTISQLKKVPGAKEGFVTMKSYKTIYIDPDAHEIESIIEKHRIKN